MHIYACMEPEDIRCPLLLSAFTPLRPGLTELGPGCWPVIPRDPPVFVLTLDEPGLAYRCVHGQTQIFVWVLGI